MKKIIALTIVLVMALGLAACGSSDSAPASGAATAAPAAPAASDLEEGLLRAACLSDISTMDVTKTTDDYMVPMNVFDRLFEVELQADGSSEIVGSLCQSYELSDDGLTYTFKLRDDVVFSNGESFTASDVKFSFERLLTAGGVNDDIALEVLGAKELKEGSADSLAGIELVDDHTLKLSLVQANAGFIAELTAPAMSIVDQESFSEDFGQTCDATIGTGPYKITEWVVNDHFTLEYNELYWGEAPSVKKCVMNVIPDPTTQNLMYQNGELDIVDLEALDSAIVASTYKTVYADKLVSTPRVGLTYFCLNNASQYLSDVRVRQAIQMAVDVDSIIQGIYNGDALRQKGIIPSGVWGHNSELEGRGYDPEAAKALLAEAGYGEGDISFQLAVDSSATGNNQLVGQVIQEQLRAVGINVELKSYDTSAWLDLRNSGKMQSFVGTWTMDYNDPANIMATFFGGAERSKIRSLNYADTEVMGRVAAASGIIEDAERMAEYQALEEKIVVEDAAWLPMLSSTHSFALGERVDSFVPYWAGFSNFYVSDVVLK